MDPGAVNGHPAVIEAGPAGIRRLCCIATTLRDAPAETAQAALAAIDDSVTLVDDQPVSTQALWCIALRSLADDHRPAIRVVHPSWWSAARVGVIRAAAEKLTDQVVVQPRSELLAQAAPSNPATSVLEITERFVAVSGAATATERRDDQPHTVAERITRALRDMASDSIGTVVIDAPAAVTGAAELARAITESLRTAHPDWDVIQLDDDGVCRLAATASPPGTVAKPLQRRARRRGRRRLLLSTGIIVVAALALGAGLFTRRPAPPPDEMPTAFLVEGRVALMVPSHWLTRRVVDGPGSARVQVSSPADPEVALHVTQSPVADLTMSETAEALRRAIDAEAPGVFVDFNPSGNRAGRPAVTYREVRSAHDVEWSVLLDESVRISIGCQSRHGAQAVVREVCDLAVRSARALR